MTHRATLDPERPPQLGLIVLQADETLEDDMRRLLPVGVSCLNSRVPSAPTVTRDTLREMEHHLTHAAALLPRAAAFRCVGYGCTSGTAEIGPDRIAETVQQGVSTPHVTNPLSALIAACQFLNIRHLGLVSPYVASVSDQLRKALASAGIATPHAINFEEQFEENVVRMSAGSVTDAAIEVGRHSDCDAVFLSCTNLRTLDVIDIVEAEVGKPVLSSNLVLAWHMCRLAGLAWRADAPGRLR